MKVYPKNKMKAPHVQNPSTDNIISYLVFLAL